jgi:dihydroorotase
MPSSPSSPSPDIDVLIKGGRVIDPANGRDGRMDVAIRGDVICAVESDIDSTRAARIVDAAGLVVTPGIIDMHVHAYHTRAPEGDPEGLSIDADAHSFRSGVTTMVDTGTAGARHLRHFKHSVIDRARTRILAYVNIVAQGMLGDWEQDPRNFDAEAAAAAVEAFPEICVGIKTAHYWGSGDWDELHVPWAAVDQSIRAAELCGMPVMYDFHPRPPERSYEDLLLRKARSGDIHTHVFAAHIPCLDENGRVPAYMLEARRRGIIFDLGHGAGSFWFRNGARAIAQGFWPDSISTDLHRHSMNRVDASMQTTMSKVLAMGVPLPNVIAMSTVNPAREIRRPALGTLSVGSCADVAVFDLRSGRFGFVDCGGAKLSAEHKLECVLTVRAGAIVFDPGGLSATEWTQAPLSYWGRA